MGAAGIPTIFFVVALAVQVVSASPEYARYRGVSLGNSVAATVTALQVTASEVATLHQRPTLVQQLTWRPNQFFTGSTRAPEPLSEMVLTFHLGRLARIAATYDRERTEGLTNADLHDAFTATYGTSMLMPTPAAVPAPSQPEVIGRWGDGKTLVLVRREAYSRRVTLTIASIVADRLLQNAIADGTRHAVSEAPAQDLVRRISEQQTQRGLDEKARHHNKAAFKP
jgi:hypothetical protein